MKKELSDFVTKFADVEHDLNNVIQILEVLGEFCDFGSEMEMRGIMSITRRLLESLDVELNDIIRQLDGSKVTEMYYISISKRGIKELMENLEKV